MRDDPASPEERESADDTQLYVEPLASPEPDGIGARFLNLVARAVTEHPRLARGLTAGVLVALLLAITIAVWQPQPAALLSSAFFPTPTPSPRQFGAPEIPAGTGWQPAGPGAAQHIVFAPSDSFRAYTCGAPGLSSLGDSVPIILDVSRDHGHNWQSLLTPARGVWCDLTVNPADAADVMLVAIPSVPGQTSPPPSALMFFRSFDGGATWRRWPLPADPNGSAAPVSWYQWAWADDTLFVAPFVNGEQGYTRLAASVASQPFAWVQQHGLSAGAPPDSSINDIIGGSTFLYLDLISQNCSTDCFQTIQTRDNGASWSRFTGQYQGQPVYLEQDQMAAGSASSLFGEVTDPTDSSGERRTYLHSEDGGFSWRPLVTPPRHLIITQIAHIPDGTIYAEMGPFPGTRLESAAPGIYALAPRADTWRFVAPYPHSQGWISLSWDERGHALALWGSLTMPTTSNYPRIGLETHAP